MNTFTEHLPLIVTLLAIVSLIHSWFIIREGRRLAKANRELRERLADLENEQ